jgi:hypothetical protein
MAITAPVLPPTFEFGVQAYLAKGSTGGCPATTTYLGVMNVTGDLAGIGVHNKMVDITPHSPSVRFTYEAATVATFGPITFDGSFVPTNTGDGGWSASNGLMNDAASGAVREFAVVWPDGTTWYFAATVSVCTVDAKVAGVLTGKCTLTVYGSPILS